MPAARSARPKPTDSAGAAGRRPRAPRRADDGRVVGSRERSSVRAASARRRAASARYPGGLAADPADVLLVLEDDAEGLVDDLAGQLARAEARRAAAQSSVSAMPGTFVRSASRRRWTKPTTSRARRSGASGTRAMTISNSFWADG